MVPATAWSAPLRVGALCDLLDVAPGSVRLVRFTVGEFLDLADGSRLMLHMDRGLNVGFSAPISRTNVRRSQMEQSLAEQVLVVVRPDDGPEDHPWPMLVGQSRHQGLEIDETTLRNLPYVVEFSPSVLRWLDDLFA